MKKSFSLVILSVILSVATLFTVVFATGTSASAAEDGQWTLVKDVADLKVGDQIIIAAKGSNVALSTTQNKNNRGQTAITKSGDNLSNPSSSVQILTLKEGKTSGTFSFYTGSGYLCAASSSSNYLKTETSLSANSSWNISITSAGVATVKATGSYTRNWMRYNSSSSLFACYSKDQQDICIYKFVKACAHTNTTESIVAASCTADGTKTTTCNDCGKVVKTESIGKLGHDFSIVINETDSTCADEGYIIRQCSRCDETSTEAKPLADHTYVGGNCSVCGEPDPNLCSHNETTTTEVPATKLESGSITVTCDRCGEVQSYEEIPAIGCDVIFTVPEGAVAPVFEGKQHGTITMPAGVIPELKGSSQSFRYEYKFAGWAISAIDGVETSSPVLYAEGDEYELEDDVTFYAVYTYSITVSNEINKTVYEKKNISDIANGAKIVITMKASDGTVYALLNSNGTSSAPTAVKVTVANNQISGDVDENILWELGKNGNDLTFYVAGGKSQWLYCTNTNNGVRVGTNDNKVFTISGDHLLNTATSRYVGVYITNPDWRCYTSVNSNITGQTLGFYVLTDKTETVTETTNYYTSVLDIYSIDGASLTAGADFTLNYEVSIPEGADINDYEMKFVMNGVDYFVKGELVNGKYVFSFKKIAPQSVCENVDAYLLLNGEVVAEKKGFGVKAYAELYVEQCKGDENYNLYCQLLADILAYGKAANDYVDFGKDASDYEVDFGGITANVGKFETDGGRTLTKPTVEGVQFSGAGVQFDVNNKIYVKFTGEATLRVNGAEVETENGVFYTDGILATDFDKVYTFELVVDGVSVQTLTYSINAYAFAKQNSANSEMAALAIALYWYGVSSEAVMSSN